MSWFSKLFKTIKTKLFSFWSKVKPEVEEAFTTFLETFGDAALKAVTAAALTSLTGNQKMSLVLSDLKSTVKAAGWVAGETALRTLVENSYSVYKASNGDNLVAPPGSSAEVIDKVGL